MRAELRFKFNDEYYGVSHNMWFDSLYSNIPSDDQKRMIERELVRQVASMIVDKCQIRWD